MGRASRGKSDRRFQRNHPTPFEHSFDTKQKCDRPYMKSKVVNTQCPVCEMLVILHDSDCQIQITGCLCTAVKRMNEADFKQFKEELARRKAKEAGLILPHQ